MERETVKLLNVLRRIARAAGYAAWTKAGPDATQFCVAQYNRVLARLSELEPSVTPLFTPLNDNASAEVIRMAARELLAYFEIDEPAVLRDVEKAFFLRPGRGRRRMRCIPVSVKCY